MSYHSLFYQFQDELPWNADGSSNLVFPLIVAMTEMNISSGQVRSLIRQMERKVLYVSEQEDIPAESWKEYIGKKESYSAWVRFFEEVIKTKPESIREYFHELSKGVFSYDFGLMIRLAYALESGEQKEVARAMAFLAAGYQPLFFELPKRETKLFVEQIYDLREKAKRYSHAKDGAKNITAIAEDGSYLEDFARLEEENENFFTLRAIVIRLVRELPGVMAKKLFCAVHAFRVIAPLFANQKEAIQQFYMVMQAWYLAMGSPAPEEAREGQEKTWQLIFQLAAVSKDPMNIMFIYSCFREFLFAASPIYPQMAYQTIHNEIKLER